MATPISRDPRLARVQVQDSPTLSSSPPTTPARESGTPDLVSGESGGSGTAAPPLEPAADVAVSSPSNAKDEVQNGIIEAKEPAPAPAPASSSVLFAPSPSTDPSPTEQSFEAIGDNPSAFPTTATEDVAVPAPERDISVASDILDPIEPGKTQTVIRTNSSPAPAPSIPRTASITTPQDSPRLAVGAPAPSSSPLRFPLPSRPIAGLPSVASHGFSQRSETLPVGSDDRAGGAAAFRKPIQSRLSVLKQRVERDPTDGNAWLELIADAEKKGDLDKTREIYKSFLAIFPDAAPQWIAHANLELGHGHFAEVEVIFSNCLRNSVSVELWAFYLNYIRRVNPIEGDKAANSRVVISQAYEFSLTHIGVDRESGGIWMDYINIVRSGEASGTWQEQQKMDSLRKLFGRAVSVPLNNVEQIWHEYDQFENAMNKMTAKKFLGERSPQYMTARSALREMKTLTDNLHRPKVPTLPNWGITETKKAIDAWKAYLQWEECNPLELDDPVTFNGRVQYAYKQAIMHMRFYPEVWYLSAMNFQKSGKTEEALTMLTTGFAANPSSVVLAFATAEQEEARKKFSECYKIYDSLVDHFHAQIDGAAKVMEEEIAASLAAREESNDQPARDDTEMTHEVSEEEQRKVKEEEDLKAGIIARNQPKIDKLKQGLASVWINELRFACRAEGIKAARAVFRKVRDSPHRTRHVFEAAAMMEYRWNKAPDIAKNIFGLGLKYFSEDVHYVMRYLDFLIGLNDDSNARALFEKTVSKLVGEEARPLWQRWAAYEYWYGDTVAGQKLDARTAELFSDSTVVDRFTQRHTYEGLEDVIQDELGLSTPEATANNGTTIPGTRSPSPVPAHLQSFGFKAVGPTSGVTHTSTATPPLPPPIGIPPRPKVRDRSYSPEERSKRPRGGYRDPSPDRDRRGGGGYGERDRGGRRSRFDSPPPLVTAPPLPRENPYAWFPEPIKFFMSLLPSAASFTAGSGPRLDPQTVLQVLVDANLQVPGTSSVSGRGPTGATSGMVGGIIGAPMGWGSNRGRMNSPSRRGRR